MSPTRTRHCGHPALAGARPVRTRRSTARLLRGGLVAALVCTMAACGASATEPPALDGGLFAGNRAGQVIGELTNRAGTTRVSDVTITHDEIRVTTDQGAVFVQPDGSDPYTTSGVGETNVPTIDVTAWELGQLGAQLRQYAAPRCPGTATGRLRPLVVDRPALEVSCPDPAQRPVWLTAQGQELPDLDLADPSDLSRVLQELQGTIAGPVYSVSSFVTADRARVEVIGAEGDRAVRITRHAAYRPTLDQLYETLPWERPADLTETFTLAGIDPEVIARTVPAARARAGASEETPAGVTVDHPLETEQPVIRYFFADDEVWFDLTGRPVDRPA